MNQKFRIFMVVTVGISALLFGTTVTPAAEENLMTGKWTKKEQKVAGSWSIVRAEGALYVMLDEDFNTKKAPDLKVFLTPTPSKSLTSKNAMKGAVRVGKLKDNKGKQRLEIPVGTELSEFKSIIIHCEKYGMLWGASSLSTPSS